MLLPKSGALLRISPLIACLLAAPLVAAQNTLSFDGSVPVTQGGNLLPLAWAGGLNSPQFSSIDLDGDDLKDLFLFDRSGNKVLTLLNQGQPGETSYSISHAFDNVFPFNQLQEWALLRDYDGDGKEDLFGYSFGGFSVYKNSDLDVGLSFVLVDTLVRSNYDPTEANLYVTQVDVPGIEDVDGDGDLDVLTFSIFGSYLEYHKNMSVELHGIPDSLVYMVRNRCWGFFNESLEGNLMTLDNPCDFNVEDPELHLLGNSTFRSARADDASSERPIGDTSSDRSHSGSSILPIDLDGDGVKDLIVGDVMYSTLIALYNGGTIDSAYMIAQDTLFPNYDTPVRLDLFPAPYYEDVDNDGIRDLIVTPNSTALAENQHGVLYYHNSGADAEPVFDHQEDAFLQDRMLDFGEGAYPVTFDADGDGLMDLLVGNYGEFHESGVYPSKIAWLRNTGTSQAPAFELTEDDYMGLSTSGIGNNMFPAFGDVDGDGDMDMYIGDMNGRLHHYRNDPVGTHANFALHQPNVPNDQAVAIDVGQFAAPQFFDVDGDGLLDLLIGERNGNINYYHNDGSNSVAVWHLENDSVGQVVVTEWWNVTGFSVPFMYMNEEGQRELLVGSESGWIHHYNNIDGNVNGAWDQLDSTWQDLREGSRTSVILHDFNVDGHKDAVIGNYRGGISYWRNDYVAGIHATEGMTAADAFTLSPVPAVGVTELRLNIPPAKGLQVEIMDDKGQMLISQPLRDQRTSMAVQDLASGVYLIRVGDGTLRWTQRLVVVR